MQPKKRLIDAIELVDTIYRSDEELHSTQWETDEIVDQIDRIPTVDAMEVVHGRWITTPVYKFNRAGRLIKYCDNHHCSECRTEQPIVPPYNYCPNCGAKMDGDGK